MAPVAPCAATRIPKPRQPQEAICGFLIGLGPAAPPSEQIRGRGQVKKTDLPATPVSRIHGDSLAVEQMAVEFGPGGIRAISGRGSPVSPTPTDRLSEPTRNPSAGTRPPWPIE